MADIEADRLTAIRQREQAATPGPWTSGGEAADDLWERAERAGWKVGK